MISLILGSLALGIAAGVVLTGPVLGYLDKMGDWALLALILVVGINLGSNREALLGIRQKLGTLVKLVLAVGTGSILGTLVTGVALGLTPRVSAGIGAGLGWYSLSTVIAAELAGPEAGALTLLANMVRELLALLLIPLLARRLGKISALAPGGATNMDTTLGLVNRVTDPETTALSFLLGAVLSALVPILVPLILSR